MSDEATPDRVQEALDRFDLCVNAEEKQRKREIGALKFQVPEFQWPAEIQDARKAQSIGGVALAARPMLSIPKLDQPIQLVLNQEKAAHFGVQVHPLNEDATDDTAETLQGLYRAIEVDSLAGLARSWAFERLVKAGRGVYRILKEYDDTSDHPSDQKIVIKRLYEQGSAYGDPAATEPDKSDGEFAFVVEDVPLKRYKRLYKDSKLAAYTAEDFVGLGNDHPGWITGDGDGIAIRVCEYFYFTYEREKVEWEGGDRTREKRTVHWSKLNAVEELETGIWDGQYIPLVFLDRELIPFDNEKRSVGVIEPNMDAQRLFNYAASGSVEMSALETKASHAIDPRQVEGYEPWWNQKNIRNFPYLPYRRMIDGVDLGPPVPIQADMSKMQVNAMLLAQAGEFIHAGTSTFEPSLGNQSPNVRTKGATLALQQQSEQAQSHWIQILADIGMTHEARIVLDLIPHVYDRPGRIARILDTEDNPKQVMFNAPFRMQGKKPTLYQPPTPGQPLPADVKQHNLDKGRYGMTVSIGKAYKSRVEQGKDELGQLFQAEPELFKILGDIYLKFADFPGHREAADRVKKMLPQQLQDQDGQQDPKLQLDQAKAALQQMQQQMGEMQKALETDKVKVDGQIQIAQHKTSADVQMARFKTQADQEIARMNNAAKIEVARITAAKEAMRADQEDYEERIALATNTAHEAEQNALDRQQQQDQMQHQAAMGAAGAGQDAAMADQQHQNTLEAGQQGHGQAMEQAQQQADLQPPPDPGAGA